MSSTAVDVTDGARAAPPISLFVRGRAAGKAVRVTPLPPKDDSAITCSPVDALGEYSADGSVLAVVEKEGVRVLRAEGGAELFSIPRPQVQALALSPKGTFLLTWERLKEGEELGNLRVWRVATGEVACAWHQKVLGEKALWPAIHWSTDEELAYRLVSNEVHFFDGQNPSHEASHKLRVPNILQCSIEPTSAPHHVASFVPEKNGAPAVLRLWQHPDYGEGRFLATKAFYRADQVNMLWRPTGGAVLVHTHSEVDKTGKSYMGETGLYYMPLEGKGKVQNVSLRKEGPIHDVQWSPLGDEFVCVFGVSPPEACIFNLKCEVTHSFGEAPRNTVSWAPHGRCLALAGFGNMSGELAFYDRKTLKCLGIVDAHMTVNYGWSPDSLYFLTAILFPRLRVDNGFRVWSCSGGLLHEERIEELTIAAWRPQPASLYPTPTDADFRAHPAAAAKTAPTSKATKYVPPGQRAAAGGGRSLSELAAAHGGGGGGFAAVGGKAGGGRSLSDLDKAMERGGSAALSGGPPPGAEAADGSNTSRNAQKQKAKREAAKKKKEVEAAGGGGEASAAATPAATPAASGGDDAQKKIRVAEKKLRQIAELKELKAGGKPLEKNQLDKIEQEEAVRKELEALSLTLKDASEEGKWR